MGRGNFIPNIETAFRLVYAELPTESVDEEGVVYEDDFAWDDFIENLSSILPKSFESNIKNSKLPSWDRDTLCLAQSGMYNLVLADNETSIAVVLAVREDAPNFAASKLEKTSNLIFDKLSDMYDLRERCGAWMSSPYKRTVPISELELFHAILNTVEGCPC